MTIPSFKINFIGNNHSGRILIHMLPKQIQPLKYIFWSFAFCRIIEQYRTMRIPQVTRNQAFESLLPGRIPQLQPIQSIMMGYVCDDEIYTDSGLHYILFTVSAS